MATLYRFRCGQAVVLCGPARRPEQAPNAPDHRQAMTDEQGTKEWLETIEALVETNDRLSAALTQCLRALREGRTLAPAVVEEYTTQLQTVAAHRNRLREILATWWAMLPPRQTH